ncbi:PREDICTED: probable long-chain-alcohol O-fatty-acyltransferase 5 [Camelina sativa]|uniref:Probable long-chain-alcohol O-fatty-acyltransferase 5 n=1 Tax=Camelina sativa TaxID=90675 RepID=A0ABM0V1N7_CAMSA|nr:PREDICTED: probable long-chain-alcohol O-fatty-acyltransferase 5 [Camelina sativa]
MDEELKNLIKLWFSAIISISYCYYIPPRIKSGVPRLLSVSPVLALFLVLPLFFSSLHLSLITAFFLTWLANFKLILFSFDKGPLIPIPSNLPRFFCFTCFPIKAQQNPKSQNHLPKLVFAIKVTIFGVLLHLYGYRQNLHPIVMLGLYFVHLYLEIEIILTFVKVLVFISLGCDLEPQSNKPYLATSLQDFWGRRWNLMVPAILRPAVYAPMRRVSERRMSSGWALFPGILVAFIVSGLVHELLFFYMTREMPTGEVTLFFVLHGVCTAAELAVKKKTTVTKRWRLSPVVSRLLTVGFVFLTGVWLFTPQLRRSGVMEKFTYEAVLVVEFVKKKLFTLLGLGNIYDEF